MQHVNSPTHLKGNILDLVLTNVDTIQDQMVSPSPHSLLSDHYTITFSMKFGKQKILKPHPIMTLTFQRLIWTACLTLTFVNAFTLQVWNMYG